MRSAVAVGLRLALVPAAWSKTAALRPYERSNLKQFGSAGLGLPSLPLGGTTATAGSAAFTATAAAGSTVCLVTMAPPELPPRAQAVLDYWLGEGWELAELGDTRPQRSKIWFMGGPEVDTEIVRLFAADCEALLRGDYDSWVPQPQPLAGAGAGGQPLSVLAGIIIGDQLSRNAFRGTPRMYAADEKVLGWAKALLASGQDLQLSPIQRVWVYMPFMHSEKLEDQDECVAQFAKLAKESSEAGLEGMTKHAEGAHKYAVLHQEVVKRWGRFPHRNAILGRESTPEEAEGIAAGTIPKF